MMMNMGQEMFSSYFIPHGHCYLWKPGLVSLHVLSDGLITLAYFLIPLELIYIVKKRQDIPFDWLFMLFGSFIICCGITHIMEIWTLWHPDYWLSGFLKAITAAVSLATAAVMVQLIPKVLAIPSPAQLAAANAALSSEIEERKQVEASLNQLTLQLEHRVQERTLALQKANQQLQQENRERYLAQESLIRSETKLREQTQRLQDTLKELKSTHTQLVQTEKMSSLGQMVAGIAHEINNPVNFIYGNIAPATDYIADILGLLDLYQESYPQPVAAVRERLEIMELDFLKPDLLKILDSIKVGAERIKEIVKSLRTFSRLDEAEMKQVNIHEGIDSTLMILQHRLKGQPHRREIQVIKEYETLPLVECYAGQINQVFMNILANGIDALEQKMGVWAESGGDDRDIGEEPPTIRIRTVLTHDQWVQIKISDNGGGIPPEVMRKIYDPFYTTKPVGYGTGLGLAISYQIMEKHQGWLSCVSQPGQGTEFTIAIPLERKPVCPLVKSQKLALVESGLAAGKGR